MSELDSSDMGCLVEWLDGMDRRCIPSSGYLCQLCGAGFAPFESGGLGEQLADCPKYSESTDPTEVWVDIR